MELLPPLSDRDIFPDIQKSISDLESKHRDVRLLQDKRDSIRLYDTPIEQLTRDIDPKNITPLITVLENIFIHLKLPCEDSNLKNIWIH
jgi:hypothetical protein